MTKINDKLTKVSDSFTVSMYDNGYMFEISGRNDTDDWATAKIICNDIDKLVELIKEAAKLPRD